jgi:KUP system potassium uptake protein
LQTGAQSQVFSFEIPTHQGGVPHLSASKSSLATLTLGAIGVVYGDIGTSVLYAIKEIFGSGHVPFTTDNIYGMCCPSSSGR